MSGWLGVSAGGKGLLTKVVCVLLALLPLCMTAASCMQDGRRSSEQHPHARCAARRGRFACQTLALTPTPCPGLGPLGGTPAPCRTSRTCLTTSSPARRSCTPTGTARQRR